MPVHKTVAITTHMTWRLLNLATSYETATLTELLATLEPQTIRYARHWQEAEDIRRISGLLVRFVPVAMGPCLKLALLRFEQLKKLGFNVVFHLGVYAAPEGIRGHAWLTLNEQPLWEVESHVERFRETYRYPANDR